MADRFVIIVSGDESWVTFSNCTHMQLQHVRYNLTGKFKLIRVSEMIFLFTEHVNS